MTEYPHTSEIEVRWRDLDPLGHVNNAVLVTYLEVSRARLWDELFEREPPTEFPFVIARVVVNYRSPILLTDRVVVGIRVSNLGRTSFTFAYRVEASGRLAADGETVQVHVSHTTGKPSPLPAAMRATLEEWK